MRYAPTMAFWGARRFVRGLATDAGLRTSALSGRGRRTAGSPYSEVEAPKEAQDESGDHVKRDLPCTLQPPTAPKVLDKPTEPGPEVGLASESVEPEGVQDEPMEGRSNRTSPQTMLPVIQPRNRTLPKFRHGTGRYLRTESLPEVGQGCFQTGEKPPASDV